ncbi:MAG TPA: FAD-dependent oxidoreductase, partial [Longimicrobiales bacterium]|nr:FAD-dependent oxidoreductase [Longimicrobiales bacterium]
GSVSAGHPPLNKPGRVPRAVKQMADPRSPLFIQPRWDPALWKWLADFARYCTEDHVQACMRVMSPLGLEALQAFRDILGEEAIDCGYAEDGYFDVCRTERGLSEARHEADIIRRHGYHPEELDGRALKEAEPALAEDVLGGIYFPEAATLEPRPFLEGLAEAARRHGAEIREGAEVTDVRLESGRVAGVRLADGTTRAADAVVLATGPFSLPLAERLGLRVPVQPGKGYHRDLPVGPQGSPPLRITCVLNETSVFCTPMRGFVRYAGTMEFSGLNDVMRRDRLQQLTEGAARYLPGVRGDAPLSEWCGLRPMAVDGLPIVGAIPGVGGAVVATGHGMLGLTLGPVSGRIVAELVLDGRTDIRWAPLGPGRFA